MKTMVYRACSQTGYGGVAHCWVSLPLVPALVGEKYLMPEDIPRLVDDTELRRHRARGPTLRSLVKLALACESAEEMGKKLKRRFDRSYTRRGITPPGRARAEAELERLLGREWAK